MTQEKLRAGAAELQKISDMMLELARLQDAVQAMQEKEQRSPSVSDARYGRSCSLNGNPR
jgi:hypothetical protein